MRTCLLASFLGMWFVLFLGQTKGQALKGTKKYSRRDTLRGYLSPLRTNFDVTFYDLSVKVEPDKKYISGSNEITFKAKEDIKNLQLDLFENMKITTIRLKGKKLPYRREFDAVFVSFLTPLKKDSSYTLGVDFEGNPQIAKNPPWDGGFIWTTDQYKNPWVAVSCQGTGASMWWPNKDHQSDEPDSMLLRVSVPNGLKDISGGRLIRTTSLSNGFTRFDWFVKNPINNYDVTLNVGNFVQFADKVGELTCDFFVLPEHLTLAKKQFSQTRTMLACFEHYFGPYPFKEDGYKLIESPYLGMEHQSAIAYGNHFQNGYLGSDLSGTGFGKSWDYILVHESAHEWFGNNITTNDIADMWVHEAFATYAEALYVEYTQGYSQGQAYLRGLRSHIQNDAPCIGPYGVNQEGSGDMYFKGANMLNTLRHIIQNDSLWWSILKKMNLVFYHKTITGEEVINFISQESKMELHSVFYQYLNTTEVPELFLKRTQKKSVSFKWNTLNRSFTMPIDLLIGNRRKVRVTPSVTLWQTLPLFKKDRDFKISPDTNSYYIKTRWAPKSVN